MNNPSKNVLATKDLSRIPLFSGLAPEELVKVAALFKEKNYQRGELIIESASPALELFFITAGIVRVYRLNKSGALVILALLGKGDFFGEMGLFTDSHRTAFIETVTEVKTFVMHKEDFKELLMASPELAWQMLGILSERLVKMDEKMENLVFHNVEERLVIALSLMAQEFTKEEENIWTLPSYLTHEFLGNLIGTSRETVTRALGRLEEKGYLERLDAQGDERTAKGGRLVFSKDMPIDFI